MNKQPNIIVFRGRQNTTPLERLLERWGYPVQVCTRSDRLAQALADSRPDLLILEKHHLEEKTLERLDKGLLEKISEDCPLIVLNDEVPDGSSPGSPSLDLLRLHQLLQRNLDHNCRRHIRMSVQLPGVFILGETSHFTNILSLGTGGAFVKTGLARLSQGSEVRVVIPLLGMKRELEVTGKVVYEVSPRLENNYQEGAGIQFVGLDEETQNLLQDYILRSLLTGDGDAPGASAASSADASAPARSLRKDTRRTGYRVTYGV